ncbi:DinB family protein [Panacibacter sp. DH6]|uniref:DinB family protein n=1 Tax=Panacibacter microcysteis TaxID=2793269 RepID=A0A931EBB2_9BACT|nr:DinB family protein [Panacibacter microcysteis]MBG9377356.1 DinB family protein [Panacibacter microcysteis]
MARPAPQDAATFFHGYINHTQGDSVAAIMQRHAQELNDFYLSLPDEKADFAYADNKWTIKQVLQHVIDAERIFAYRAVCIARKDKTPLPGFDENSYADHDGHDNRSMQSLKNEFVAVRKATDLLFESFTEAQLAEAGTSGNKNITVNALCFITYGHLLHHKAILAARYV